MQSGVAMRIRSCLTVFFYGVLSLALLSCSDEPEQAPRVKLTETVLVENVQRLGINLGDDFWYSGAVLTKERIPHGGFEGVLYRQITWGPRGGADWYADWFQTGEWGGILEGATATFLTGPAQGIPRRIMRIDRELVPGAEKNGPLPVYRFDRPLASPRLNDALLLESRQLDLGYVGQHGGSWWVFGENGGQVQSVSDPRPGSKGQQSVLLDARKKGCCAGILAPLLDSRWAEATGDWRVSFWAKGSGELVVYLGNFAHRGRHGASFQTVKLWPTWKKYTLEFSLKEFSWRLMGLGMSMHDGVLVLDEVSCKRLGDENPTAFRDDVLRTLRRFQPGVLRYLQLGGSSLENILRPREYRLAYSSSRSDAPSGQLWPVHPKSTGVARFHSYGLHEFLTLCESVGTSPWYCLPGTFTIQEMQGLIEYLAGPETTRMGALRAARGHPEPWTSAFEHIYLEVGNEAWNDMHPYRHAGFNLRAEYWESLFSAAALSPYSNPKIHCVAGSQAVNAHLSLRLAQDIPHASHLAIAPYILHDLSQHIASQGAEAVYMTALAVPRFALAEGELGHVLDALQERRGPALAVYEVNHHPTGGDAPEQACNDLVTGVGAGVNLVDWMLSLMERGVLVQNMFQLAQFEYPGSNQRRLRLWGCALNMKEGAERYRPTFLAAEMVNWVLQGKLLACEVSGSPMLRLADFVQPKPEEKENRELRRFSFPALRAYATKDGKNRGLVLVNLHPRESLRPELNLEGNPRFVRWAVLAAPKLEDSNEPEHRPEVHIEEEELSGLDVRSGITLPPHSLTVLSWEEDR